VIDFDASTPENRVQARDKETGDPVWSVEVVDPDPEARTRLLKVKIAARTQPVLPDSQPGSPFRPVEFDGPRSRPTS